MARTLLYIARPIRWAGSTPAEQSPTIYTQQTYALNGPPSHQSPGLTTSSSSRAPPCRNSLVYTWPALPPPSRTTTAYSGTPSGSQGVLPNSSTSLPPRTIGAPERCPTSLNTNIPRTNSKSTCKNGLTRIRAPQEPISRLKQPALTFSTSVKHLPPLASGCFVHLQSKTLTI